MENTSTPTTASDSASPSGIPRSSTITCFTSLQEKENHRKRLRRNLARAQNRQQNTPSERTSMAIERIEHLLKTLDQDHDYFLKHTRILMDLILIRSRVQEYDVPSYHMSVLDNLIRMFASGMGIHK